MWSVCVKVACFDNVLQTRAAQDLFRDAVQPILKVGSRNIRNNVLLWNARLFHQDESTRAIRARQNPAHAPHGHPDAEEGNQEIPLPPARQRQVVLDVDLLGLRFEFLSHWLPSNRLLKAVRERHPSTVLVGISRQGSARGLVLAL